MNPKHIPGVFNIADFLSRCLKHKTYVPSADIFPDNQYEAFSVLVENAFSAQTASYSKPFCSFQDLIQATINDPLLQTVKRRIVANQRPTKFDAESIHPFHKFWPELNVSPDGLLMRNDRIVIPQSMVPNLLKFSHDGHMGINATKRLLRHRYYFPNMDDEIEKLCLNCLACQVNVNKTQRSPIISGQLVEGPLKLWSIDFSSKTPENNYVLVLVDEFSSYPIFEFSNGLTTTHVIKILSTVFKTFGIPETIKSDNGPAFISSEFKNFAIKSGFKHQLITPEWPQANSTCERLMASINKRIRCATVDQSNWRKSLLAFLDRYRATPHSSRKYSPNDLMGFDDKNWLPSHHFTPSATHMKQEAKIHDAKAKAIQKKYNDLHAKQRNPFKVGNTVLCKQKRHNKFSPYFNHIPYTITAIKGTMITAENHIHSTTRNESYFKCYNGPTLTPTQVLSVPNIAVSTNYSMQLTKLVPSPTNTEPEPMDTNENPNIRQIENNNTSTIPPILPTNPTIKASKRGRKPKRKTYDLIRQRFKLP